MGRVTMIAAVMLVVSVGVVGCSDVQLSTEHDAILDQTVSDSQAVAELAESGQITDDELVRALCEWSDRWAELKRARDEGWHVILSPTYDELLDRAAARSLVIAETAQADALTRDQMITAVIGQAEAWKRFQDARDGKEGESR